MYSFIQFPLLNAAPNAPPCPRSQIPVEVSISFVNEDTIAVTDSPDPELKKIYMSIPGVRLGTT